jgi:hypothetical protein
MQLPFASGAARDAGQQRFSARFHIIIIEPAGPAVAQE